MTTVLFVLTASLKFAQPAAKGSMLICMCSSIRVLSAQFTANSRWWTVVSDKRTGACMCQSVSPVGDRYPRALKTVGVHQHGREHETEVCGSESGALIHSIGQCECFGSCPFPVTLAIIPSWSRRTMCTSCSVQLHFCMIFQAVVTQLRACRVYMHMRSSGCLLLDNPGCPHRPISFAADSHMSLLEALLRPHGLTYLGRRRCGSQTCPRPAANFLQPLLR
ncbi:unnamed protein product [Schistocephalus solidus]|uniref:Secreted protein n=1 Tax=Schistocephalus solidus TaxID=70667 RepID=A0A183SB71_SCHSO|nr:unnamed protein product [Schistocephalus solidus]